MKPERFVEASLLGDGCLRLRKANRNKNANYQFSQIALHKDYVDWICEIMKDVGPAKTYFIPGKYDKKNNITAKDAYRLETGARALWTPLYYKWYPNNKKTVPSDLTIDAQTMAIWIMDDGTYNWRRNTMEIYSMSFDEEQHKLLKQVIYRDLNLEATIGNHHGFKVIRFNKKNLTPLIELISPYMLPSFEYKVKAPEQPCINCAKSVEPEMVIPR